MKTTFLKNALGALMLTCTLSFAVLSSNSCKQTEPEPTLPELEVTTEAVEALADGGEYTINYTLTGVPEDARPNASAPDAQDWITDFDFSEMGIIKFKVVPNAAQESRTATITVTYEELSDDVPVTQLGAGEEPGPGPGPDPEYDVEFEAEYLARGEYYGDMYSPGAGDYLVTLGNDMMDGNYVRPNATYYVMDIYGPIWDGDMSAIGVPEGEYKLDPDLTYAPWTFTSEYGGLTVTDAEGYITTDLGYTEGTLTVTKDGDNYIFDLVVTIEETGEIHHVTYTGPAALKDNTGGETEVDLIENDIDFEMNIAQAVYDSDYGSISLQFTDMAVDAEGYVTPPGTLLTIEAYMDVTEDGYIVGSTLEAASDMLPPSFYPGEMLDFFGIMIPMGTYAEYLPDDSSVQYGFITGGTITLDGSSGYYDIDIDLITAEGYHITSSKTNVALPLNGWNPGGDVSTTLTGDYEMDLEGCTAEAAFYGDYYGDGGANWMFSLSPTTGADGFQMEYSGATAGTIDDGLATGTFYPSEDCAAGTYLAGYLSGNSLYGTWYVGGFDAEGYVTEYAPAVDGGITITSNGGVNYTLTFDCVDDAGNNFTGTWTGDVALMDYSSANVSAASRTFFGMSSQFKPVDRLEYVQTMQANEDLFKARAPKAGSAKMFKVAR